MSHCPNSPATSPDSKAKCEAQLGESRCGAKAQKYAECFYANEKCNADGTYDSDGTRSAATAACKPLLEDYVKCFVPAGDGGTPGDGGTTTGQSGIFGDLEMAE